MGNTKLGHLWYNYMIVKNLPEVPEYNSTRLIQAIMDNRY